MKILIVNEGCVIGGIETWMISLWGALQDRGHSVELFFFMHGPMEQHLPPDCVTHFGDLPALLRLVDTRRFDIVHAHSGDITFGVSGVRALGARLVVTSHGWIIPGWTSFSADAFAASSRWLAEGQRPSTDLPVRTIGYGIDTARFKTGVAEASSPPVVAWIGRGHAVEQKRIDKLAAVAPALEGAGLRLWLAEASGVEVVRRLVPGAAEVLAPIAEFWEEVPREAMPEFLRRVAASRGVVLSTSSYEGLGLAYVEAQACGCPVIGPDVRGVNEAVRPEHGGVLYRFDLPASELARLVVDVVSDQNAWDRRRDLGIRFAREHFSLERMTNEYLELYRHVLGGRRLSLRAAARRLRVLLGLRSYLLNNWSAAQSLYEASGRLAEEGHGKLARAAARTALTLCPTIYLRPRRLLQLLRIHLPRRRGAPAPLAP
jgi:glycosyltransferase involved in cell wall biosynthesis